MGLIRSHKTPKTTAARCPHFTLARTHARTRRHTLPWESETVYQFQQLGHLIVTSPPLSLDVPSSGLAGEGSHNQIPFLTAKRGSRSRLILQHSSAFHRRTTSFLCTRLLHLQPINKTFHPPLLWVSTYRKHFRASLPFIK